MDERNESGEAVVMANDNPQKENWKRTALRGFDPLSTDPQLLERYMKYLDRTVREDEGVKHLVFFTVLSAFTPCPINTFLKGESSIGKTYNAVQSLQFFDEEIKKQHIWLLGAMSPTALIHSKADFIDNQGYVVDWADKPSREKAKQELRDFYHGTETKITRDLVEQRFQQARKAWDERIKNGHYEVDLTNKILVFLDAPHLDTFNKLRPILSHDAKEISYRFTDKTGKGRLQTTHVKIKGFPATIFCSSEETFIRDLATRSFNITPETSNEKISSALDVIAEKKVNPWQFEKDKEWVQLEAYLRWWIHAVKEYKCIIPYAKKLKQLFPLYGVRVMRDFDHFLTLIEVSALFRFVQRPLLVKDKEKIVLATFEDFYTIMKILPSFEESTRTGLSGHVLQCFNHVMKPLSEEIGDFDYATLTDRYNEFFKEKKSSKTLYSWVKLLAEVGLVTTYRSDIDKRKFLIKIITDSKNSIYSSLEELPSLFSLERFKTVINELKIYSSQKLVLYNTILQEHNSEIDALYNSHFQEEYFFGEDKTEQQLKTEKKLKNSSQEQSRQSPTIDEAFSTSCWICQKPIPEDLAYCTYLDGKPVHCSCARKLEAERKQVLTSANYLTSKKEKNNRVR